LYQLRRFNDRSVWNLKKGGSDNPLILSASASKIVIDVPEFNATGTLLGRFSFNDSTPSFREVEGTVFSLVKENESVLELDLWSEGVDLQQIWFDMSYYLNTLQEDDYFQGSSAFDKVDAIRALGGDDRFKGNGDQDGDYFFGGDGLDTSIYRGKLSDYVLNVDNAILDGRSDVGTTVSGYKIEDKVSARDGRDYLNEVERLKFEVAEVNGANHIALDIEGNAGTAAKILGALWGKESVENSAFVGIVLHYLDSGVSYEALLGLGLNALLGANKTNEAVASLLYTNLMGEAPTQDAKTELASYMDSGAYSQAGFARAIADLELNATNINLVGLSDTGLQYTEYVP
jgi:hypothetical protein